MEPAPGPPTFHVVLHEPEIPNNTGNIGRTCVATDCALHLIHPLGFSLDEKACRRAGLDYWPRLRLREHDSFDGYLNDEGLGLGGRLWLFSTRGPRTVFEAELRRGDHLVFGKETAGLPEPVLGRFSEQVLCLPMVGGERSLNVATAVCAVVYEGVRQLIARGEAETDARGRLLLPPGLG